MINKLFLLGFFPRQTKLLSLFYSQDTNDCQVQKNTQQSKVNQMTDVELILLLI